MIIDNLDKSEALRYLGYGNNQPDEKTSDILIQCEKELIAEIKPRYLHRDFLITRKDGQIYLSDSDICLKGKDVYNLLEECDRVVLLCATIGAEADKLIRTAQVTDMAKALIMDSLANVAIEQVCGRLDSEIKEAYKSLYQTWRFSPGYGDMPLDIQKEFLALLNAPKKIGLCVTDTNLLTPKKSVTAIIGLSDKEITRKNLGCESCNMKDRCNFRKTGKHCGN